MRLPFRLAILLVLLTTNSLRADDEKPKKPVFDDPFKVTDPDFQVQGEYLGEFDSDEGKKKLAVQVIAQGQGKFHIVAYFGGFPGEGWDKSEKKEADAQTKNGVATVETDTVNAYIKDGKIAVVDKDGNALFELPRVSRQSPTLGAKPPEGAIVLFDGTNTDAFNGGKLTDDKLLIPAATTKQKFQSGTLHLEFRTPYQPEDSGQARGNSGCYLQGRYEVQVLDSFGLEGKMNEAGGIYSVKDPDLNMCFPPLAWQTYDIDYTAAKYDADGKLEKNARMTVRHNGVVVQNDVELPHRKTTAAPVDVGHEPGPIYLQDHGNQVRYRNIWIVEKK
jgi:hypothetical protein